MRSSARVGALFNAEPAAGPVDLELLIVATAAIARSDERLCVMAASWLAEHHQLVNVERLCYWLTGVTDETSAVTGAMLAIAFRDTASPTPLADASAQCRHLAAHALLFPVVAEIPGMPEVIRAEALPLFAAWGFWHNDAVFKRPAIRPLPWILEHCEELRDRAIIGAKGDAERDGAMGVARLVRIVDRAEEVFGTRESALRWLTTPNRALGGLLPARLANTDAGALSVDQVLGRIEHGNVR